MPESDGVEFLGVNCEKNAQDAPFMSVAADFSLSGSDSFISPGVGVINATLAGSGSAVGWPTRVTGPQSVIFNQDLLASTEFMVRVPCCTPTLWEILLGFFDPPATADFTIANMATMDCACVGVPCTGFPQSLSYDFVFTVAIINTNSDKDNPLYAVTINAFLSGPLPCAFTNVLTWVDQTPDIAQADLIGTHTLTTTVTFSGATTTLVTTVTIA